MVRLNADTYKHIHTQTYIYNYIHKDIWLDRINSEKWEVTKNTLAYFLSIMIENVAKSDILQANKKETQI